MSMKQKFGLLLILPLLLASCSESTPSTIPEDGSSDGSSISREYFDLDALTAIEALQYDDISFQISTTGGSSAYTRTYAPDYFLYVTDPYETDRYGYLNENGGVSQFVYYDDDEYLSRSELLYDEDGNYYSDYREIVASFDDIDTSILSLSDDGTVDLSKNKRNILALFEIMNVDTADIFALDSLTASYEAQYGDTYSPNGLVITASFAATNSADAYTLTATISRYNAIYYSFLEDFLENPTAPFEASDTEKRVRDLFATNSFVCEFDNDGDDVTDGYYYFTPTYFYTEFTLEYEEIDPTTAFAYGDRGYIIIQDQVLDYYGTTLYFNGCYMFYNLEDGGFYLVTREDPNTTGFAQNAFTQVYTDITYVMNYPSNMTCVNSFEKATENEDGNIVFTDSEIISDFVSNHNLAETISSYALTSDYLEIIPTLADDDKDCRVTFKLWFTNGQYYQTDYTNFTNGEVDFIEEAIANNYNL